MNGRKRRAAFVCVLLWMLAAGNVCVWAAVPDPGEVLANGGIPTEGWDDIDRFLREEVAARESGVTFSELVKTLMAGDGEQAGRMVAALAGQHLAGELKHGGELAGKLLALGLIGAVFANFSNVFGGSQISETGSFMTYLLAFTVLAAAFFDSIAITGDVLTKQTEFMKALLPAYFLSVAWAGGSISSAAWMELVLFLIAAVQEVYRNLLLPLTRVCMLLTVAGNMARENMLSRLTELLRTGIGWGTRSLLGVVLGFQLIQGLVLPYADAVRTTGVQKLLQVIPGVGAGAGALAKLVLGSGVLVKNTMGAAAAVVLVIVSVVPVLKLAVLLFLYRAAAALLQPVGEKRLVACINGVADAQKLLLGLATSGLLLFLVTIALICAGTNVAYLV